MPASFLYFIPKVQAVPVQNIQELLDVGLDYVNYKPRKFISVHTLSGPGEQPGNVISIAASDDKPGPPPAYEPEKQKWRKSLNGKYWIGIYTDSPPKPEDLLRKNPIPGEEVTLLDGNSWIIPVCCPNIMGGEQGQMSLPQEFDLDDDGNLIARVQKAYAPIADRCYQFFQRYTGMIRDPREVAEQEGRELTDEEKSEIRQSFQERVNLAVDLLAINYHIGKMEVIGLLNLFGSDQYGKIIRAAIEADEIDKSIADIEKKLLASDASDTLHGSTGGEQTPNNAAGTSN